MVFTFIQKVFHKIMYSLQDDPSGHILAWISRIVAFPFFLIVSIYMDGDVVWGFMTLAAMTIMLDSLFYLYGAKESHFKSKKFFQDLKITTETFDRFTRNRLIVKSSLLTLFILFSVSYPTLFEVYFLASFFSVYIMARFTIYKHFDITKYRPMHHASSSTMGTDGYTVTDTQMGYNSSMYYSNTIPNHGASGYDYTGSPSNSPTSIGGMSG